MGNLKIQEIVFEAIYLSGRKIDINKIRDLTSLTKTQIYSAVIHLERRRVIKKERIMRQKVGYCSPPCEKIEVYANMNNSRKVNWLMGKIKKEREEN